MAKLTATGFAHPGRHGPWGGATAVLWAQGVLVYHTWHTSYSESSEQVKAEGGWGSKIIITVDGALPRGHHANRATGSSNLRPARRPRFTLRKYLLYEARLDAAILVPIKRVTGRPGRKGTAQVWACKGTAQVWARRDLEEGKGSRAQGEEEYG